MKKIIITLGIVFLFVPAFANAQVDSKCFTKDQCVKARTDFGSSHPNEGFYEKPDCGKVPVGSVNGTPGESMGFCLPASETVTQIGFGGRQNFANIGEFLKYIYKYGVMVAGILATVMIIVAGFQWVASGGNSATIGEAKKRIFGAIIGLVLAVGSYTILETINPALVEFRLPQIWMINKIGLGAEYCDATQGDVSLAISSTEKQAIVNQSTDENVINSEIAKKKTEHLKNISFTVPKDKTECGAEYFMQDAGANTCHGNYCEDKTCAPYDILGDSPNGDNKRIPFPYCWGESDVLINLQLGSLQEELYSALAAPISSLPAGGIIGIVADIFKTPDWLKKNTFKMLAACKDSSGNIETPKEVEENYYKLQIWETKSSNRFSAYTLQLYVPNSYEIENKTCGGNLAGFYLVTEPNLVGNTWKSAFKVLTDINIIVGIGRLFTSEGNLMYFSFDNTRKQIIISQSTESPSFIRNNYFPVDFIRKPTNHKYLEKAISDSDL